MKAFTQLIPIVTMVLGLSPMPLSAQHGRGGGGGPGAAPGMRPPATQSDPHGRPGMRPEGGDFSQPKAVKNTEGQLNWRHPRRCLPGYNLFCLAAPIFKRRPPASKTSVSLRLRSTSRTTWVSPLTN